jgi:hypothetical protein
VSSLTFLEQTAKGDDVIAKCTVANSNVPNLGTELTEFVACNTACKAANEACEAAKTASKAKTAARNAAQKQWKAKFKALAGKIENITGGEPEAVLSLGLDLKAEPTPEQPIEEPPTNLRIATNGTPGKTKISADPLPGAVMFAVEACPDPIEADGWAEVARPRKPACTVDAEPGKKVWYRIAGINGEGQGPWSDPVPRPVM